MRISYFVLATPVALLLFLFLLSRPPEPSFAPGSADPTQVIAPRSAAENGRSAEP